MIDIQTARTKLHPDTHSTPANENFVEDRHAVLELKAAFDDVAQIASDLNFHDTKEAYVSAITHIDFFHRASRALSEIAQTLAARPLAFTDKDIVEMCKNIRSLPNPNFADDGHVMDLCDDAQILHVFYEASIEHYAEFYNFVADYIGWKPNLSLA